MGEALVLAAPTPFDRLVDACDPGPFAPLPSAFQVGDRVTLWISDTGQRVSGRFALAFDDDDPDDGNGPTFRILGDDEQVWESPWYVDADGRVRSVRTGAVDHTVDPFTGKRYDLVLVAQAAHPDSDLAHYRLQVPGEGRLQSTDVVFAGRQIILCGDLAPGDNDGAVSTLGYGLRWFSERKSDGYLCSKFLRCDRWHEELANTELGSLVADDPTRFDPDDDDLFTDRAEVLEHLVECIDNQDAHGLGSWFIDHGFDADDIPGWGMNPRDVRLLVAIHARFVTLYAEQGLAEVTHG